LNFLETIGAGTRPPPPTGNKRERERAEDRIGEQSLMQPGLILK